MQSAVHNPLADEHPPANSVESVTSVSCVQSAVHNPMADEHLPGNSVESVSSVSRATATGKIKSRRNLKVGDVVSVSPTIFDGKEPGSFSQTFPERCYGTVLAVQSDGTVSVEWENKEVDDVKLKDLKRETDYVTSYKIY